MLTRLSVLKTRALLELHLKRTGWVDLEGKLGCSLEKFMGARWRERQPPTEKRPSNLSSNLSHPEVSPQYNHKRKISAVKVKVFQTMATLTVSPIRVYGSPLKSSPGSKMTRRRAAAELKTSQARENDKQFLQVLKAQSPVRSPFELNGAPSTSSPVPSQHSHRAPIRSLESELDEAALSTPQVNPDAQPTSARRSQRAKSPASSQTVCNPLKGVRAFVDVKGDAEFLKELIVSLGGEIAIKCRHKISHIIFEGVYV